jgi:hypothetical protein
VEKNGIKPKEIIRQVEKKHIFTHIEWNMSGIYMEVKEQGGDFVWLSAQQIKDHVQSQLAQLPRYSIAAKALEQSRIIVVDSREDMVELANLYGAEHLIISVEDPWEIANQITAAGSIFVGNYSPESAGDYASGTNHTLPTMGLATAYSGIGLESFMHSITYQELSQEGLNTLAKTIITMAEAEGLDAHANAVKVRITGSGVYDDNGDRGNDYLLLINMTSSNVDYTIPVSANEEWKLVIDTGFKLIS